MSLDNFEIIKYIGNGSFGIVYKVRRKIDNKIYALKKVNMKNLSEKEKINSLNEITFLSSFSHQNIISYKESFYDKKTESLNLILEYASEGDLKSKIINQKNIKRVYFKEKIIWYYFIQIVKGLKILHDNNLIHRDLKSENIFICKNGILKLGDLNIAKLSNKDIFNSKIGTLIYAAPEIWNNKPYSFKSDIWSLGIILYELCTFNLPFNGNNIMEIYKKIMKGFYLNIPNIYSKELYIIINMLLQFNPNNRPTCDLILDNKIVQSKIKNIFGDDLKNDNFSFFNKNSINLDFYQKFNYNNINSLLPKFSYYENEGRKSFSINEKRNFRNFDIHTFDNVYKDNNNKTIKINNNNIIDYKKNRRNSYNFEGNKFFSNVKIYKKEDFENNKNNSNIIIEKRNNLSKNNLNDSTCSSNNSKSKYSIQLNDSNNDDDNKKNKVIFTKKISLVNKKLNLNQLLSLNKENIKSIVKN